MSSIDDNDSGDINNINGHNNDYDNNDSSSHCFMAHVLAMCGSSRVSRVTTETYNMRGMLCGNNK